MATFTRQDAYTFLIGLGAAVGITVAEALVRSSEALDDPTSWAVNLLIGILTATGRYLLTELTQRGFSKSN